MKKLAAILLILTLAALCVPAFAMETDGLGDTVTRNAELAAFLDGSGNIYVSGLDKPVNATKADSLVSIDPYRILFFAQANASAGVPQGRLVALTLDGFAEAVITDDAYAACLSEENVYYISKTNRAQIVCYNLDSKSSVPALTAAESLDRIYASSIGVITTLVDGAGAYITDPITGQFVPYADDAARQIEQGDGFEAYLTDSSSLYVRANGALSPTLVDGSVRAWAIRGRNLYYLSGSDGALALKQYNVDANLWTFVLSLPTDAQAQLTASENSLFVISNSNEIYSVDVAGKRLVNYATLPTPQSYAVSGTRAVTGYRIEAVSGQLNVYGVMEDTSQQPAFTFVDFSQSAPKNAANNIMLLSAYAIDAESTVWDLMQPAPQYSPLRRGSRGDAVSAIQQPLYDKGYYNYYIDGIFGWRTERAVKLLQDMLGLSVNGVADESLQRTILTTDIPAYDPYRALQRGDRGLRVTEMQQQLRDLGYLADDADSVFGPRTQAAVELFQRENGLGVDGIAGSETLRRLFSDSARTCSSYIDLRKGDTGYRVRELNRRLRELYYLEGDAGSTYTAAIAEAVRRFQQEVGLRQTGEATEAVQRELFSRNAPEYSGYITLRRGDDNDRVLEMQRRLKELGYYDDDLDGYFGKGTYSAVRAFQRQTGLKVTGVANPATLERLYDSDAPAYQAPIELTMPVVDLIGMYETDEDGVYLIPSGTEYISFFWGADGVESYDVTLSDGDETYTLLKNDPAEEIEVVTDGMFEDVTYTLKVTAHPQDKVNNKDASGELRFQIVSEAELPTLDGVTIHIDGDFTYSKEEDVYSISREALRFWWEISGEAASCEYAITEQGSEDAVYSDSGDASLTSVDATEFDQLTADTIYTLTVTAYPMDDAQEAVSNLINFNVLDDPASLPTIEPTPDDENTPEPEEESTPEPGIESTPEPDSENTAEPGDENTAEPGSENTAEPGDENANEPGSENTAEPGDENADEPGNTGVDSGETPSDGEGNGETGGDANSASPALPDVQAGPAISSVPMDVTTPDGSVSTENVIAVGEGTVELSWVTEGNVTGYNVRITDASGNTVVDQNLTNPGARVDSNNLTPDEVYTMTATAYFDGGESTSATAYFMKPGEEIADAPTQEPVVDEPASDEPATEPTADEPANDEPAAAAAPLGAPSLRVAPGTGEFEAEIAHPNGDVTTETVVAVGDGTVELSWAAEGDVAGYQVTITDSNGNVMVDKRLTNPGATIDTQILTPGEIYKLAATAYSNSGEETAATLYFTRPAPETEESEAEEPAPEPAEEPLDEESASEPADEPIDEESAPEPAEEPEYEEPAPEPTEEPEYEEPAPELAEESEAVESEPEPTEEPTPEPTEEPTPEPTEEPTPEPTEEPTPANPYPMDDPSAWNATINANSDPAAISVIQKRLKEWGWLSDCSDGALDEATVQAVINFQSYCAENGLSVTATDPANPTIETDTLRLLFNADGNQIRKP